MINTPNTASELMEMNAKGSVETIMEMIEECTPREGMEIVLKCLSVLRNIHTDEGMNRMKSGDEKSGFIWMKDGVTIHNCMEMLNSIEM